MSSEIYDLSDKVEKFLNLVANDRKLAKLYSIKVDPVSKVTLDLLTELITKPFILEYDEETNVLYYIDNSNEKRICPDIENGITTGSEWVSDSLPPVPFDINQGGNLRMASEAENIYKCVLISGILKGEFLEEFKIVMNNYDFLNLRTKDDTIGDFSNLLFKWQELQSLTIRIIVSGASYKISSEKNLDSGFIIGCLNREETLGVVRIRDQVKALIRSYMLNELSPVNVRKLTKIERLKKIQEKDDKVLAIIQGDKEFSELYKICSMNSDYLPASVKIALSNAAINFVRKDASDYLQSDEKSFKKLVSVCRRRAFKEAVIALKEKQVGIWRVEGNFKYKLPSKI